MVSVCLPSDALLQHLPSYLGFSYLGRGVSLHGCSSKAQPLLLTLGEGYLLTTALPDLPYGLAPLGPPAPTQPQLLGHGVGPPGHCPWPWATTALPHSMKLSHARGATPDGRVMVEISDRMLSTGEGNGKPLQYSCLENPMNSMKRQNDRILKEKLPRSAGAEYATGDQWRNKPERIKGWSQSKNNTQLWM